MKSKKQYICNNCGAISYKWSGQCIECSNWNSITEYISYSTQSLSSKPIGNILTTNSLNQDITDPLRIISPMSEF